MTTTNNAWTCSYCGQRVPYGELHACSRDSLSPSETIKEESTAAGYWICSRCGAKVPYGQLHVCPGGADIGSSSVGGWPSGWFPSSPWPYNDWPYDDNVISPEATLEERRVRALERIAGALEKLAQQGV